MSNIILILTQVLQLLVVLLAICSPVVITASSLSSLSSSSHPILILDKTDLEYSDTSNGEVTNSDQQVVYINHGGGAVSTIRRSFAIPFSPHVSSYPSSLFDSQQTPPQSHQSNQPENPPVTSSFLPRDDFRDEVTGGFARRAGASEERGFDDSSFDEPTGEVDNSFRGDSGVDHEGNYGNRRDDYSDSPRSSLRREDDSVTQTPPPPPPLGLPVPPTSFGLRTNNRMEGDLVRLTESERHSNSGDNRHDTERRRSFTTSENHPRSNNNVNRNSNFDDQPNPRLNKNNNNNAVYGNNNNNVNPFLGPLGPLTNTFTQGLNPDFFGLFDSPFTPLAGLPPPVSTSNPGNQDNLFQRRRLNIQNVVPDIVHNGIGGPPGGYPSYNYFTGGERGAAATTGHDENTMKWPKIFKFTDGRINLNDFEKDKKLGRIKFMKKDPVFDDVRRDSFLILHGGTYS